MSLPKLSHRLHVMVPMDSREGDEKRYDGLRLGRTRTDIRCSQGGSEFTFRLHPNGSGGPCRIPRSTG